MDSGGEWLAKWLLCEKAASMLPERWKYSYRYTPGAVMGSDAAFSVNVNFKYKF